jgi:hypothetical protein
MDRNVFRGRQVVVAVCQQLSRQLQGVVSIAYTPRIGSVGPSALWGHARSWSGNGEGRNASASTFDPNARLTLAMRDATPADIFGTDSIGEAVVELGHRLEWVVASAQ